MTLTELRTAKAAKGAEIRAKTAEIDTATGPDVPRIAAEHAALIADWDRLDWRERALAGAEAREADLAMHNTETIHVTHYGSAARASGAERGHRNAGMQAAMLHRFDSARYPLPASALDFRGMSLMDMAVEVLTAEGSYRRGDGRSDVAQRALQSTSDFPMVLGNVANRTLLDAYQAAPQTFKPLGKKVYLKDFRPANFVRLGNAPQLQPVMEGGEYKRGVMGDSGNTLQLQTYGAVAAITRQVLLNDDLGAFTDVPSMFGRSAANLESDIVWAMILANPVIVSDSTSTFNTRHNNVVHTGGGNGPPSVATIATARAAMAKQTNDSGTLLNIKPRYLVTPSELEITTAQLLYPIQATQVSNAVPEAVRSLSAISEPRLSLGVRGVGGSATAWYLFADPSQVDTFAYGYLDGQDGPYTETRMGFDVDGMEVKCRHDFAANFLDYRGAFKNEG